MRLQDNYPQKKLGIQSLYQIGFCESIEFFLIFLVAWIPLHKLPQNP